MLSLREASSFALIQLLSASPSTASGKHPADVPGRSREPHGLVPVLKTTLGSLTPFHGARAEASTGRGQVRELWGISLAAVV